MEIEVKIAGMTIDPVTRTPVVFLQSVDGKHELPILIGLLEAASIAVVLEGIQTARPMTHDLTKNLVDLLGGVLEKVTISNLKENTYYALLYVKIGERMLEIDSRPSDAIALALRYQCPMYVDDKIFRRDEIERKAVEKVQKELDETGEIKEEPEDEGGGGAPPTVH